MNESYITVHGYVVAAPTVRTVGEHTVANFRIGVTPRKLERSSGEWRDAETQWYSVSAWRALGDNVARSLDADAMKRAQAAVAAFKLEPVNLAANFAPLGTWDKKFNPGPVVTDRGVITKVQIALSRLGFYQGPRDGRPSPALNLAVAAYQREQGLPPTGALDQVTMSRLVVFTR